MVLERLKGGPPIKTDLIVSSPTRVGLAVSRG